MQDKPSSHGDLCPTCGQPKVENRARAVLDNLPDRAYVRAKLLTQIIPMGASTLWRKVHDGEFPKPVKLSKNVTGWRVGEVREWIAGREEGGPGHGKRRARP